MELKICDLESITRGQHTFKGEHIEAASNARKLSIGALYGGVGVL
jgi:hypothetical protein